MVSMTKCRSLCRICVRRFSVGLERRLSKIEISNGLAVDEILSQLHIPAAFLG